MPSLSTHVGKRVDQAISIVLFCSLILALLAVGAFSGGYPSTSLLYFLPFASALMIGFGVVPPLVRKHKGEQTEQSKRLLHWSFRFCLLFLIGTVLLGINAPLISFDAHELGFAFSLNTAQVGFACIMLSVILFVAYYLPRS